MKLPKELSEGDLEGINKSLNHVTEKNLPHFFDNKISPYSLSILKSKG